MLPLFSYECATLSRQICKTWEDVKFDRISGLTMYIPSPDGFLKILPILSIGPPPPQTRQNPIPKPKELFCFVIFSPYIHFMLHYPDGGITMPSEIAVDQLLQHLGEEGVPGDILRDRLKEKLAKLIEYTSRTTTIPASSDPNASR